MYTDFFSLSEKPFSITPDPAFLFLSKRHEEALAHLLYGVTDSGGFIQLTGEVGTGKTTIIRSLFEQIPDNVEIALILNPRLSVTEFLQSICEELHLELSPGASNKDCFDVLNPHLLTAHAEGRKLVLLVDEAQNLSVEVLEQIRLLTNLETHKDKLLQIILVGQPELQALLHRQDLRQLAQRITARYYLKPLNKQETCAYIKHRLGVAGARYYIFKARAEHLIFKATKGIPRLINVVCDRALLGAFSQQVPTVDAAIAKKAINEVLGDASLSMNKERTGLKRQSSLLHWVWMPILLFAFIAWQFPQIKDWADRSGSTQAHSQDVEPSVDQQSVNQTSLTQSVTKPVHVSNASSSTEDSFPEPDPQVVVATEVSDAVPYTEPDTPEHISVEVLFAEHAEITTAENAFNQLLLLWGRSRFYEHSNACDNLKIMGLRCLLQNGQWEDIVQFNRPVILEVFDAQSMPHQLLLSSMDENRVIIKLDSGTYSVSLSELQARWQGSYMLFWQPEQLDTMRLSFSIRSDSVVWLREQLESLGLLAAGADHTTLFDAHLREVVKKFQASQGILADGIVGPETFLVLNNALELPDRPKLYKDK